MRGPAVLVLVTVAVVAAALAGPWRPATRVPAAAEPEQRPAVPTPTPEPTTDPFLQALEDMDLQPWDLSLLWTVLGGALVAALVFGLVRWVQLRPRRRAEGLPDAGDVVPGPTVGSPVGLLPDLPTLREGLDDAGAELRSDVAPADAVIAAWVLLEDAAGRSGVVRDRAWTPTEFTVSVLDRTPADRAATRRLLDLYLQARFGGEPMTPDDVAAARRAVSRLAADLVGEGDGAP